MDFIKYLTVLLVLLIEYGESGGHGEKHHDHVRLHVPEFHHHDHHTKVITIHHHHHKPKKHHHHHHHHHQPHIPSIPSFPTHNFHHKTLTTHTVAKETKGHKGHHGHHSHHHHGGSSHSHGSYGSHGHHGHHSHSHGHSHHHDPPYSASYEPASSFEDDFGSSYSPPVPSYGGSSSPHIQGIQHTVKQVKVYDSLPGVIPNVGGSNGYEVTEQGEDDDDHFTSVNSLHSSFPATFGYLRSAAPEPASNSLTGLSPQSSVQFHNSDPFQSPQEQPSPVFPATGGSAGVPHHAQFSAEDISLQNLQSQIPSGYQGTSGFDNAESFAGSEGGDAYLSNDDHDFNDDSPVSFAREAGIQQLVSTGGLETSVY